MDLQVKKLKVDISATPKKNSDTSTYRGKTAPPRQRQITHSPQLRERTKKTYFKMHCFKSAF